ncbi:T20D4.11-like domain-containing protein [Caenorhabditis elegans]|uniref:T20D4.11-like domain-containing protein n=1 Tax=Caenorhabditis elegans TaxID=6239 RepID=O76679_CAEEL|nr:DUF19 domain-containing protein [Caenorhabditis elegans]CCD62921.1 DUF19 domain-containing protein [Caenorhabditis elegans]|eukprot:NP_503938.1 Uncharacterized protein CELE_C04E12.2 [Caenorhabditis elegans]
MRNLLKFALLGTLLLTFAYGAYKPPNKSDCKGVTVGKVFTCLYRAGDYMAKTFFLDIKKASSLLEFSKSCIAMQNCLEALRCGQGTEHLAMYERMRGQCVTMHFYSTDFFSCLTKLENSKPKPECYEKWDTKLVNEDLTEVSPDKLCKKMFGTDNCMKKVVKETCGDKDWQLLLQHFNEDTPGLKHCDFSNV